MKKIYYIASRVTSDGCYFEKKRGQVFEVGGLWFGCARSFKGRISTITELSTGLTVADAKKRDAIEIIERLLPAIKDELKKDSIQKVAKALREHAAKQAKAEFRENGII